MLHFVFRCLCFGSYLTFVFAPSAPQKSNWPSNMLANTASVSNSSSSTPLPAAPAESFKHTCLNCCVRFAEQQQWRDHYKTDWHRYNLKRSVAQLPPVTATQFHERILRQRELDAGGPGANETQFCAVCRKQFGTAKSYANHLQSRTHHANVDRAEVEQVVKTDKQLAALEKQIDSIAAAKENVQKERKAVLAERSEQKEENNDAMLDSDDLDDGDSDEWDDDDDDASDAAGVEEGAAKEADDYDNPIDSNKCIFCDQRSDSMVANLKHMSLAHSFFVPDTEYVVDLSGLMRYLGEKVARDFICLWCNDRGRTFFSLDAARKHMRDKGHCKMLHEGLALAEYAQFYDYSSSYPDNVSFSYLSH